MNLDARDLARKSLESALGITKPGFGPLADYGRGLAGAFADLGLVDTDEELEWSARFERSARPLEPPPAELHARAVELLERELDDRAPDAEPGPDDPLGRRERFTTKLQALLETGIIDWAEGSDWTDRLDRVFPDRSARPEPPAYVGLELRAVAIGPDTRLAGLRITSVEMYDDCVIVRWHLLPDDHGEWWDRVALTDHVDDLIRAHCPASLQDDLGTAYLPAPAGVWTWRDVFHLREGPAVMTGASAFTPGTPPDATKLSIACASGDIEIRLHAHI